jgi:hypothetical protein
MSKSHAYEAYLANVRIEKNHIDLLFGIPYPSGKWFNRIESNPDIIKTVLRSFCLPQTNILQMNVSGIFDCLKKGDNYSLWQFCNDGKHSRDMIKFLGYRICKLGIPIDKTQIYWNKKDIEITPDYAKRFLQKCFNLNLVMKNALHFENYRDIPDGHLPCFDNIGNQQYLDLLKFIFDGDIRYYQDREIVFKAYAIDEESSEAIALDDKFNKKLQEEQLQYENEMNQLMRVV